MPCCTLNAGPAEVTNRSVPLTIPWLLQRAHVSENTYWYQDFITGVEENVNL